MCEEMMVLEEEQGGEEHIVEVVIVEGLWKVGHFNNKGKHLY